MHGSKGDQACSLLSFYVVRGGYSGETMYLPQINRDDSRPGSPRRQPERADQGRQHLEPLLSVASLLLLETAPLSCPERLARTPHHCVLLPRLSRPLDGLSAEGDTVTDVGGK